MTNRYFLYARKSTNETDKQVRSIDDQIAELRNIVEREHLDHVVDELKESGSAKVPGRPTFNEMLDRIERGEADGILAWHPDRLARNSLDGGRVMDLIDRELLRCIRFSTFWFEPTPQGKFMLSIAFGMSKYHSDKLSEDVRRGLIGVVREGRWPMTTPLGYLRDPKIGTIAPDPSLAPLVRMAFELYAPGQVTLRQLRDRMTGMGLATPHGKPLPISRYHRMLKSAVYCGLIPYRGEVHEGKHVPIVTRELFDSVQVALRCRGFRRPTGLKPYLYRGIFTCGECGAAITVETHKTYVYLRCTKSLGPCSQHYLREDHMGEHIIRFLSTVSLPPEVADDIIAIFVEARRTDRMALDRHLRNIKQRLFALDAKIDAVLKDYLAEKIALDEYHKAKNILVAEKRRVKDRLDESRKTGKTWYEPAIRFISDLKRARELAEHGSNSSNRDFIKQTGSNLLLKHKQLVVEPTGPWKLVVAQGWMSGALGAPGCGDAAEPVVCSTLTHQCPSQDMRRTLAADLKTFFTDMSAGDAV